ncbi:MAG: LamG-like jellyroll fold domain-containing protein [Pseudomonadota bacterium]
MEVTLGCGSSPGDDRWIIDNISSIHGVAPMVLGTPLIEAGPPGNAVCFDGDDALVLDANPLQGLPAFTLEVLLRIDAVTTVVLNQPRYLHIETTTASRATMEARVTDTNWYLDTYLLAGTQNRTLVDPSKVHPVGAWTWTALTYDAGQMRHFVDGIEEATGAVNVPPLGPGKMSLGVRQNLVNWFKGCIRELRITPTALAATELQKP